MIKLKKLDCFEYEDKKYVYLGIQDDSTYPDLRYSEEDFDMLSEYLEHKISVDRLYDLDIESLNSDSIEDFVYNLMIPVSLAAVVPDWNFDKPVTAFSVLPTFEMLMGTVNIKDIDKSVVKKWYLKNLLQDKIKPYVDVGEILENKLNKEILGLYRKDTKSFLSARKHYLGKAFDFHNKKANKDIDLIVDDNYYYFVHIRTGKTMLKYPVNTKKQKIVISYLILNVYETVNNTDKSYERPKGRTISCYADI